MKKLKSIFDLDYAVRLMLTLALLQTQTALVRADSVTGDKGTYETFSTTVLERRGATATRLSNDQHGFTETRDANGDEIERTDFSSNGIEQMHNSVMGNEINISNQTTDNTITNTHTTSETTSRGADDGVGYLDRQISDTVSDSNQNNGKVVSHNSSHEESELTSNGFIPTWIDRSSLSMSHGLDGSEEIRSGSSHADQGPGDGLSVTTNNIYGVPEVKEELTTHTLIAALNPDHSFDPEHSGDELTVEQDSPHGAGDQESFDGSNGQRWEGDQSLHLADAEALAGRCTDTHC